MFIHRVLNIYFIAIVENRQEYFSCLFIHHTRNKNTVYDNPLFHITFIGTIRFYNEFFFSYYNLQLTVRCWSERRKQRKVILVLRYFVYFFLFLFYYYSIICCVDDKALFLSPQAGYGQERMTHHSKPENVI